MNEAAEKHRAKWFEELEMKRALLENRENLKCWMEEKLSAKKATMAKRTGDMCSKEENDLKANLALAQLGAMSAATNAIDAVS